MKRYIASDFHNGNEVGDYGRVMGFLDLVEDDADEFLILGDFEELLWSNFNILTTVKPYSYVTEKVKAIAREKPVKIVLGNHDWNLERAADYARENGHHTVILGHTHFPAAEVRGGIKVYNTGDQMESYSYAVQENGIIGLRAFS